MSCLGVGMNKRENFPNSLHPADRTDILLLKMGDFSVHNVINYPSDEDNTNITKQVLLRAKLIITKPVVPQVQVCSEGKGRSVTPHKLSAWSVYQVEKVQLGLIVYSPILSFCLSKFVHTYFRFNICERITYNCLQLHYFFTAFTLHKDPQLQTPSYWYNLINNTLAS